MFPRISKDLPPIKGKARRTPEQTKCTENLFKQPSGDGNHIWILIKKTGLSTSQACSALSRATNIAEKYFFSAGSRDRNSVTYQWFSIKKDLLEFPQSLKNAGYKKMLRVEKIIESHKPIDASMVKNLSYELVIDKVLDNDDWNRGKEILDLLRKVGCPNYNTYARSGKGTWAKWGKMITMRKRLSPQIAKQKIPHSNCVKAFQAMIFNKMLASRIESDLFTNVMKGDVIQTAINLEYQYRTEIITDSVEGTQKRLDSWEAVTMLPMFGREMQKSEDSADEFEQKMLKDLNVKNYQFSKLQGSRRAIRFQPGKIQCELHKEKIKIDCELPTDASVCVLLEELLKPEGYMK